MAKFPKYILEAIKCGYIPKDLEAWKTKDLSKLSTGEKVLRFAKEYLVFPEGKCIGQPLILDPFQCAFILAVFDAPHLCKKAILSMARRGGKTLVMAVILLSFIVGALAKQNTNIRSAAMTREQAGLLYRLMALILQMSPKLAGLWKCVPSSKRIIGLNKNADYQALSRDAKSGHGQAIYVLVVDECGQIDAPNDDFLDMLFSSLGSYEDSRTFLISTQAPNDSSFFSVEIDTSEREKPSNVVCHVYTAKTDDLFDETNWYASNPSLYGGYRSKTDIEQSALEASRIPAKQNGFLNLFMNRRVSLESIWLAPSVWRDNSGDVDMDVFRHEPVSLGLDLSAINDLSCAVIAAKDDEGNVHVKCYSFTPLTGIKERSQASRVPFDVWAKDGVIYAPAGKTLDYEQIATWLKLEFERENIVVGTIHFDRWRSDIFFAACNRVGFATGANHDPVGQGYQSFSPRIEAMETGLLQGKIRHGNQPVLNMGASTAIVISDAAGNRKLTKESTNAHSPKIDGIVAMTMSVYPFFAKTEIDFSVDALIG